MMRTISAILALSAVGVLLNGCGFSWRPMKRSTTLAEQRMVYPSEPTDESYVIVPTGGDASQGREELFTEPTFDEPAVDSGDGAPRVKMAEPVGGEVISVPEGVGPAGPANIPTTMPDAPERAPSESEGS